MQAKSKPLTDPQVFTLRRMASGTKYLLRGDCRKGEEVRRDPRGYSPLNSPSLPVLFNRGLVEFTGTERRETAYYQVRLTEAGVAAAKTEATFAERGELPRGADQCPTCKVGLHWHQIHGMRLISEHNGGMFYDARCPKCGFNYKVKK